MPFDIQCPNCGTRNELEIETRAEAEARVEELRGYTCNSCGKEVDPQIVESSD